MWAAGVPGDACATDRTGMPQAARSCWTVGGRGCAASRAKVATGPAVGEVAPVAAVVEAVAVAEVEVDPVVWEAAPVAVAAEAAAAGPGAVGAATDPLLVLRRIRYNEVVCVVSRLATPPTS